MLTILALLSFLGVAGFAYQRNTGVYTRDEQSALCANEFKDKYVISGDVALDPHTPGRYIITKGSAAAITLGAPTAGAEDGLEIEISSSTAFAHVLTATGLLQDGAGHVNTATCAAQAGCSFCLTAFNGKWLAANYAGTTFA
jgi:hypothetical protein